MIKAILFDRDGVIVNSEPVGIRSGVEAFRELGIEITDEDIKTIIGRHPVDYANELKSKYTFSVEEFLVNQKKHFYQLFDSIEVFTGMVSVIKELKLKGYKLGLTTSSGINGTNKVLEIANLNNIFDVVVTFEDCKERKPNPEPYLITAQRLNVDVAECIVIEDSQVGLEAAKNANMTCIVVPNEYTSNQDFSTADFVTDNPNEIITIVNNF